MCGSIARRCLIQRLSAAVTPRFQPETYIVQPQAPRLPGTAAALAEPEEQRASPQSTRQDRQRIKSLERELACKEKALAEAAALLVLSEKVGAIFNRGEDK